MTNSTNLSLIYLDSNATTPVHPAAAQAVMSTMTQTFGNPSSSHITGIRAKDIMEKTRNAGKKLLGIDKGQLIFTSGATEGIQTAILSALVEAKKSLTPNKQYYLLYGATEHKAVPNSLHHWNQILGINAEIKAIPVDHQGKLDLNFIAEHAADSLMICTMAVNNETGVYQDLTALETTIRTTNPHVYWMVDCVQVLGKRNLNIENTSIDYAPFSGHKLYAPKGIGFVYVRSSAPFTPFIAGGGQESGQRSGTENLPGIASLKAIFDILNGDSAHQFSNHSQLQGYRLQIIKALKEAFGDIVLNHSLENTVPTTINFAIPGFSSKEIMDLFDAANIRVSSGSACSSKVTRSFVLDAMGLPAWQSESAIRMSFGPMFNQDDCDQACERIISAAKALKESCLVVSNEINETPLDGLVELRSGNNCCWVYADKQTKTAVVIDPVHELIQRIVNLVNCQGLTLKAVLDTHGHADHESSRNEIAKALGMSTATCHLGWPTDTDCIEMLGQTYSSITIGNHNLVKVPTAGHTADSVSYLLTQKFNGEYQSSMCHFAFCGDTILMGSLGRTNFETSSSAEMYASLRLLNQLVDEQSLICASHDYYNEFATTIALERGRNQLLNSVLSNSIDLDTFCEQKSVLDSHLNDEQGQEIQCGAYVEVDAALKIREYDKDSLARLLKDDQNIKLVDIREPHEYALQRSSNVELNVPMTRLVQFINERSKQKQDKYVLVCRSGSRSLVVAQALGRLGFENVGHLKGGYALGL
ncbi:aminotransferase class V-fold PLP-dependent enzyme [Parashewanella curva]|uniref:cysteine desulfurase n=1 Tax=Parashewanella curva TaxID=2338552 RepID=A0A3L8PX13_9GAMM|nr:aminotransferase class V-fold PLP-dependent enzyme [Parashewanella curva]RLV59841.1 aminotransferase class V-fold PLP-dependent enzyme [Parashewanella curva]